MDGWIIIDSVASQHFWLKTNRFTKTTLKETDDSCRTSKTSFTELYL